MQPDLHVRWCLLWLLVEGHRRWVDNNKWKQDQRGVNRSGSGDRMVARTTEKHYSVEGVRFGTYFKDNRGNFCLVEEVGAEGSLSCPLLWLHLLEEWGSHGVG